MVFLQGMGTRPLRGDAVLTLQVQTSTGAQVKSSAFPLSTMPEDWREEVWDPGLDHRTSYFMLASLTNSDRPDNHTPLVPLPTCPDQVDLRVLVFSSYGEDGSARVVLLETWCDTDGTPVLSVQGPLEVRKRSFLSAKEVHLLNISAETLRRCASPLYDRILVEYEVNGIWDSGTIVTSYVWPAEATALAPHSRLTLLSSGYSAQYAPDSREAHPTRRRLVVPIETDGGRWHAPGVEIPAYSGRPCDVLRVQWPIEYVQE